MYNMMISHSVLPVIVVSGTGPNLMGRKWLETHKAELGAATCYVRAHPTPRSIELSPHSFP